MPCQTSTRSAEHAPTGTDVWGALVWCDVVTRPATPAKSVHRVASQTLRALDLGIDGHHVTGASGYYTPHTLSSYAVLTADLRRLDSLPIHVSDLSYIID